MASLCTNRFESFGPYSSIHPSLPTSCFLDVIVVPLPTWLYLVAIALLVLALRSRNRASVHSATTGKQVNLYPTVKKHSKLQIGLQTLYGLLIIAMLAMISLEIARSSVARLGIGLLPFSYVGVLLAALIHWLSTGTMSAATGRFSWASSQRWILRSTSAIFWVFLLVAMAIKAAAAKTEENRGYLRTGVQANYPVDDSFVDNLTMVCVEFVLAGLEMVTF